MMATETAAAVEPAEPRAGVTRSLTYSAAAHL